MDEEVQKEKLRAVIGGLYIKARILTGQNKTDEARQRHAKAIALIDEYRRRFKEEDD